MNRHPLCSFVLSEPPYRFWKYFEFSEVAACLCGFEIDNASVTTQQLKRDTPDGVSSVVRDLAFLLASNIVITQLFWVEGELGWASLMQSLRKFINDLCEVQDVFSDNLCREQNWWMYFFSMTSFDLFTHLQTDLAGFTCLQSVQQLELTKYLRDLWLLSHVGVSYFSILLKVVVWPLPKKSETQEEGLNG